MGKAHEASSPASDRQLRSTGCRGSSSLPYALKSDDHQVARSSFAMKKTPVAHTRRKGGGEGAERRLRLSDIAERAGVSSMTVSLALRGGPGVSQRRAAEIRELAREMGYQANAMASALASLRWARHAYADGTTLGWLNFWARPADLRRNAIFEANWQGVVEAAGALGYRVEEFACGSRITPERLRSILLARGVRGVVLPPQRPPVSRERFDFDWRDFAVVRLGHSVPHPPAHMITHSQASDTALAFEKTAALGYERIGLLTTETIYDYSLFGAGYLKKQFAVPVRRRVPPLVLADGPEASAAVRAQINGWMRRHRPDAIISTEHNARRLLEIAGHRVPRDVALVATSVGNSDATAGIQESPREVGRVAAKTLIGLIQRGEFGLPANQHDIFVHGTWTGGDTLPPRKSGRTGREVRS